MLYGIEPVKSHRDVVLDMNLVAAARKAELTVSEVLELYDPSDRYTDELKGTSAFERQLIRYNLPVKSDPSRGIHAVKGEYFLVDEQHRILFKEFLNNEVYFSLINSKYNVDDLLAITRRIDGETALMTDIDTSAIDANPFFKVSKMADFPTVTVSWSDRSAYVSKRGVAVKWSYEFLRRARVDLIAKIIERIAMSDRKASFNFAVSALYNSATTQNVTTFDTTCSAHKITYAAWCKWLHSFDPYEATLVIANIDAAMKVLLMTRPNLAPADAMRMIEEARLSGGAVIQNPGNIAKTPPIYIVEDTVMSNDDHIMVVDKRFALERMIELGSDISETQRFITNQTEVTTFSLTEGYNTIFAGARKVLNLGA